MKLLGYEDMIAGILLGIIMIGKEGSIFTLPYADKLFNIFLFIFIILAILDIFYELKTITEDFFFSILAVVWNIVEIILCLKFISEIFGLALDFTSMIPLIGSIGLIGIGIFFIAGNIIWLYLYLKH